MTGRAGKGFRWELIPVLAVILASLVILTSRGLRVESPWTVGIIALFVTGVFGFACLRSRRWLVLPVTAAAFFLFLAGVVHADLQKHVPDPMRQAKVEMCLKEVERIKGEVAQCKSFISAGTSTDPDYLRAPTPHIASVSRPFQRGSSKEVRVTRSPAASLAAAEALWKANGTAYMAYLAEERKDYENSADYWRTPPRFTVSVLTRSATMTLIGGLFLAVVNALVLAAASRARPAP